MLNLCRAMVGVGIFFLIVFKVTPPIFDTFVYMWELVGACFLAAISANCARLPGGHFGFNNRSSFRFTNPLPLFVEVVVRDLVELPRELLYAPEEDAVLARSTDGWRVWTSIIVAWEVSTSRASKTIGRAPAAVGLVSPFLSRALSSAFVFRRILSSSLRVGTDWGRGGRLSLTTRLSSAVSLGLISVTSACHS